MYTCGVGVGVGLFKLMVLIRKLIQLRLARVKTVKLTYVDYTRVVCGLHTRTTHGLCV